VNQKNRKAQRGVACGLKEQQSRGHKKRSGV
jgi:hypothetical protein